MITLVKKLLDDNPRVIKKLSKRVEKINALEDEISRLSDSELSAKTEHFKDKLQKGETLDDILEEAFAVVREAAKRLLGMRHFDVQLMGGIILHEGRIAEMKTGEGKTLVATLAIYLNALSGQGVHLITVNDYLAKRDAKWMGPLYHFLGLSVGSIQHDVAYIYDPENKEGDESLHFLREVTRREAYMADITYGTNNEFGFDYLRDNMVIRPDQVVQRDLNFSIVDEVDSILIDEARTPLIISGMGTKPTDLYQKFSRISESLKKEEDYTVDEKAHSVPLTDEGVSKVEERMGVTNLFDNQHIELSHHINAALKAKELFKKDVHYVVKDGEIVIVDEFTGRLMFGRRYSDGLHQAIEAKERVRVRQEDQTLASITFQNYFRLYKKLGGMTGTAATEEQEFRNIYNVDVVEIPTHRPMVRKDHSDRVYKSEKAKFKAVVEEISEYFKKGQPVLVGTRSIEKSEELSFMLKRKGIEHQVLNAKYHEKEAHIIAQAGRKGGVTIATNMAGRGVDIILGGNPPDKEEAELVKSLGGLHILGTERHESRRIDNQLRGRSGRQGDLGSSRFYVSLEDELMRLFGSDKISGLMDRLGVDEDIPIEHGWISKGIENAQMKVESHHFSIRKSVLEYDDVMNKQREVIYAERKRVLSGENLKHHILNMLTAYIEKIIDVYVPADAHIEDWDINGLYDALRENFPIPLDFTRNNLIEPDRTALKDKITSLAKKIYDEKEEKLGFDNARQLERLVVLQMIDTKWIDHLYAMDILREGIGLRAYGQRDPRIEYINEAFEAFETLKEHIQEDTIKYLYKIQIVKFVDAPTHKITGTNKDAIKKDSLAKKTIKKVGRNDPCSCGSGKKFKKCCGTE